MFAKAGFEQSIVLLADSPSDERSWCIVHADSGPLLLCLWYRPPCSGEIASISRFQVELQQHSRHAVSCLVVGDLNVHNVEWLRFSRRTTIEGRELEQVCCENGPAPASGWPNPRSLPLRFGPHRFAIRRTLQNGARHSRKC